MIKHSYKIVMVKVGVISQAFKFRQRLIDNKPFSQSIEKSKSRKKTEKLIKKANSTELDILRELIKNIAKKNIEVSKSILNTKKKFAGIVSLISSYMRMSTIHRSQKSLRKFLLKFSTVLPIAAKTVLK